MFLALLACVRPTSAPPQTFAIVGVRVFDGERLWDEATVVVQGERITAVGAEGVVPAGAEVIEGEGRTLLPGLIDAHTHCRGPEQLAQSAVFGVTTELDMMCPLPALRALREAAQERPIADLRSACNPVTVPGGHGTEYGLPVPVLEDLERTEAFVDERLAEGADYLKLMLDDGNAWGRPHSTLSPEQVRRAVAAAHARHKLAVAHVATPQDARTALEASIDGLMHLYTGGAQPELAAQIAAQRAFVVPTLSVLHAMCEPQIAGTSLAADAQLRPYLPPEAVAQLRRGFPRPPSDCSGFAAAVAALHAAGVTLLAGSDAPNPGTTHGASLHGELALLVEAGLTPAQALTAATSAPARAFGLDDRGRIEVGKRADLLLVQGDPTQQVTATRDIVAVWVRGQRVLREPALSAPRVGGLVSDFDDGTLAVRFGSPWLASSDQRAGGTSIATIHPADGALSIDGEVKPGPGLWAGAWFSPGGAAGGPVDLSDPDAAVSLRARGDPGSCAVMLFTASGGRYGASQTIEVGQDWASYRLPLSAFGIGGSDVTGLFIGSKRVGAFHLEIDDVILGP
jgi:imidazolonepropionase-like amidohydrolase